MLVFVVLGATVLDVQSKDLNNNLKIQGKILSDHSADIQVWENDPSTNEWTIVYDKKEKTKYSFVLNPELNYKLEFTNANGDKKVMHVDAGKPGLWLVKLDINFNAPEVECARMYQSVRTKYYILSTLDESYTSK